jgi:hypothetical protein
LIGHLPFLPGQHPRDACRCPHCTVSDPTKTIALVLLFDDSSSMVTKPLK